MAEGDNNFHGRTGFAGEYPKAGFALSVSCDTCEIGGVPLKTPADWRARVERDSLVRVHGAFAIAFTDATGTLHLARDKAGERSLYYMVRGKTLYFSSRIHPLIRTMGAGKSINTQALALYLSCAYVPGRETLVEGIFSVLPGEVVSFHNGSLQRQPYWSLPGEGLVGGADEPALTCELRKTLEDAVRRRLPPSGDAGVTLSGGLDSSLVAALVRKQHDGLTRTYSIHFGEWQANELEFSSLVARHCDTVHQIVEVTPGDVKRKFDQAHNLLSQPVGDPLTIPNLMMFEAARWHCRHLFNGEGGDPCFGGPKNIPMLLSEIYGGSSGGDPEARVRNFLRSHGKFYDELNEILSKGMQWELREQPAEATFINWFSDPRWPSFVNKLMAINIAFKGSSHILHKVDHLSAPSGIIPCSPLMDEDIMEMSFTIPPQMKLRGSVEKHLLKQAVLDLLPPEIINRPKSGMLVPVEMWFDPRHGRLRRFARKRLMHGSLEGLFSRKYISRLLNGEMGRLRPRRGQKIWLLLSLESWLRTVYHGDS
jgi:asparagine synthase (glutamine-hydrolysing)